MKVLNCRGNLNSAEIDHQDYCHFANSDKTFHPNAGFWEIDVKKYVFKRVLKEVIKKYHSEFV